MSRAGFETRTSILRSAREQDCCEQGDFRFQFDVLAVVVLDRTHCVLAEERNCRGNAIKMVILKSCVVIFYSRHLRNLGGLRLHL